MALPKPLPNTTTLIPYEQFFIESLFQEGQLIPEQYPGEQNMILQLAADPSYTPQGETSRATSLTPNTVYAAAPRTAIYFNIRYVLSNTFNLHIRTYLIPIAFTHNNLTLPNNEFTKLRIYYI